MFLSLRTLAFGLLVVALISVGCSRKTGSQSTVQVSGYAVTCVAVLPAAAALNFDETLSAAEKKQLDNGLRALDEAMKQQFISRSDIRLVSDGQISGMTDELPAKPLARAQVIGDRLSCNAVLETTLHRYQDRVGKKYSAKEPASVAFSYRLLAIPEGTVLCSGTFDEEQQSVMENLFDFSSAKNRGFTWITAEELLREGVDMRFRECSYLTGDE